MNPDNVQQTWQMQTVQTRVTIDADLLLQEVRRNQQLFTANIFRRDVMEVGTGLVMVPVWIFMGAKLALPWTWYLTVPVLLWIAGFMLIDRLRHKRQPPEPSETLRHRVENSLAQVEHQIWLLRNVFWWYLLPPTLSILTFFGQVAWEARDGGWWTVLGAVFVVSVLAIVYFGIYRLNQTAVRALLEPRRQELAALLTSLQDEPSAVGAAPNAS